MRRICPVSSGQRIESSMCAPVWAMNSASGWKITGCPFGSPSTWAFTTAELLPGNLVAWTSITVLHCWVDSYWCSALPASTPPGIISSKGIATLFPRRHGLPSESEAEQMCTGTVIDFSLQLISMSIQAPRDIGFLL